MSATKRAAAAGLPHGPGSYLTRPPNPARIAACFGLFLLGAVTGTAGALLQAAWFPGGLFLALVAAGGLFRGGGLATGTRPGIVAPAGGWVIAVLLLTATRAEGDFVFGAGAGSYLFLLGGLAVAMICATLPQASKAQGEPPSPRPPGGGGARLGK
ncbi:DUF6113 family protein [Streptomyces sulfonofaciens]|nr:DUF6113 family protein [Streptomyces sulfonofaciens]